jgi:tRNA (guanine37-N1)-methyltransferase
LEIDIITLFPEMCVAPLSASIMGRAQEKGSLTLRVHDLRQWATDKHRRVDDTPFGGGQGMVMKPEPFFACVEELRRPTTKVVLMTPQGHRLEQALVEELATSAEHLLILCGHYEGVDHRVIDALVDIEISIGDYILTNGAIAANILIDAITRLLPGVLGDDRSAVEESFSHGLLEAPAYTRPVDFRGMKVPDVLLSGHHQKIIDWKHQRSQERTRQNRPDLMPESDET